MNHALPLPMRSADEAAILINHVITEPLSHETLCFLLDDDYGPVACVIFDGHEHPDEVISIAELIAETTLDYVASFVSIVSCRPGHGFSADDVHRWHQLDHFLGGSGIELLEWFVRDEHALVAVSAVAGEPSRWPAPA